MLEAALGLCVGSIIWCLLKGIALILRKVQRPKYYPQERMRRQALARERRRIRRRTTLNAAPTADDLLAQWAKVKKNPEEMIRFGSMLCDLEAYVDNSLLRNENGEIVGRNPGIRGWLNANCQPLACHYKTVMGYKAMAEKFRQAVGLADPYPAALALDGLKNTARKDEGQSAGDAQAEEDAIIQNTVRKDDGWIAGDAQTEANVILQNTVRKDDVGGSTGCETSGTGRETSGTGRETSGTGCETSATGRETVGVGIEAKVAKGMACRKARRKAAEMFADCGRSQRGIRLALAAMLSPDQVPPEIEREERRRQGLPPHDGLARRFVKMMA